ncbi:MAG: translation initiation factor IF-5A [Candidatus Aenigmarchaeota archaeon]|nr:translation initiation factor IF-5A [Candidatus Aenigmarchaeota archaeon]
MPEMRDLKEGGYVLVDGEPCKVLSLVKSKPGKHGEAKARIEVIGIFDGKKRSVVKPVTGSIQIPMILKKKAQVVSVQGDSVQLMDLETYEMFDLSIPSGRSFNDGDEVVYIEVEGRRGFPDK